MNAEFQEFPTDSFGPPESILRRHFPDQEGLFPVANQSGQQDEERSIYPGAGRLFHLPMQNDQLLAQQSVFYNEGRLASAKICECSDRR